MLATTATRTAPLCFDNLAHVEDMVLLKITDQRKQDTRKRKEKESQDGRSGLVGQLEEHFEKENISV